jgi:hypothetical protein
MAENFLPDFLGIGAVKASTTWLYRNLYQHPALYLPITKPVRYFDRHRDKPIETYKAIFKPGAGRLCGEFSASYSVLPVETIAYIHRLMPDLKLIFLMREPKARAWSEAKMEFSVVRGLGDKAISDDEYCEFIASEQCRTRGDYRTILTNWRSVFPASQIFVGLMDDVEAQPKEFLGRLFDFLGVSRDVDYAAYPVDKKIFAGRELAMPERCRALLDDMYKSDQIRALGDSVDMNLVSRWGYA